MDTLKKKILNNLGTLTKDFNFNNSWELMLSVNSYPSFVFRPQFSITRGLGVEVQCSNR